MTSQMTRTAQTIVLANVLSPLFIERGSYVEAVKDSDYGNWEKYMKLYVKLLYHAGHFSKGGFLTVL